MATIKALVRQNKINHKGEAVIYLRYGHRQKTSDISLGISVTINSWDASNQKVNSIKGIRKTSLNEKLIESQRQSDLIVNSQIENAKSHILTIARKLQLEKIEPHASLVKEKYLEKEAPIKNNDQKIISLFEEFRKLSSKSDATKANYKTAIYHINKYQEDCHKVPLRLSDITLSFIDRLKNYLYTSFIKPDQSIGLTDNSVGTTFKNFKVFLKHLESRGHEIPLNISEIKVPKAQKPIHFLTEEEIELLRNFQFKEERLKKVRDLFIFNCFVGLRFADLQRFTQAHIANNIVTMVSEKTQKDIFVPLTKVPLEILENYNYALPKISEQKFNEYIKEACRKAGISSLIEDVVISSGNKKYTTTPKFEKVTSHTAIKSFITMCVNKGIPPKDVAEMTGKSVEIITRHYYGINRVSLVSKMSQAYG